MNSSTSNAPVSYKRAGVVSIDTSFSTNTNTNYSTRIGLVKRGVCYENIDATVPPLLYYFTTRGQHSNNNTNSTSNTNSTNNTNNTNNTNIAMNTVALPTPAWYGVYLEPDRKTKASRYPITTSIF